MNPIYDYIQNIKYFISNFNKKKEQYRKKVNFLSHQSIQINRNGHEPVYESNTITKRFLVE